MRVGVRSLTERGLKVPFGAAEGLARTIPGARLVAYDGVGHVPMEQIPDRSAADVRALLQSVSERTTPH